MAKNETTLTWRIPEYRQYERKRRWYIIAGAALLILIGYAIIAANFLFAIIIIIAGLVVVMQDRQRAPEIEFAIGEEGVMVGEKFYDYRLFRNFWAFYEPNEAKTLFLEFKNRMRPRLSIPLLDQNPLEIRAALRRSLPEDVEKENEPLSEQLARLLKL